MIQRDLRDGGRRGEVHTLDRIGSCQTVSKGEESKSQTNSYLYRLLQKKVLCVLSERRIQEIEDGEKREKTAKLSALYTQLPPSILR